MQKDDRRYITFIMLLPRRLNVEIHRAEEGGFWARIKELPGCVTQGEDFFDLVAMINDAVCAYFEVPKNLRKSLGRYVPEIPEGARKIVEERARHQKIEEAVREIIKRKRTIEFNKIGLS